MPKIAVAGKGGVGKTTFSGVLARVLAAAGQKVYAIDADPNPTLGQALGFPPDLLEKIVPVVEMRDLIEERTGARPGESGAYFRLNPRVDDIPERFSVSYQGVHLLEMGTVKGAGAGCVCPENTVLRALVTHLLLREKETVLLDMVAGVEHLGRGTAAAVDAMYVVVEPGQRSLMVAADIERMAGELGVPAVWLVANKVRDDDDLAFVTEYVEHGRRQEGGDPPGRGGLAGWLPRDEHVVDADMRGVAVYDAAPEVARRVEDIARRTGLI